MDLIIFLLLPGSCYTVSRNPPPPALVISRIRDIIVCMNANFQARSTDKSEVLVIGLKSLLYKYPRRAINTDMIMINASSVLQTSWRWWEDEEYVLSYFFFLSIFSMILWYGLTMELLKHNPVIQIINWKQAINEKKNIILIHFNVLKSLSIFCVFANLMLKKKKPSINPVTCLSAKCSHCMPKKYIYEIYIRKMTPHRNHGINPSHFHLRNIIRLRQFLNTKDAETLLHDFIAAHIHYCSSCVIGPQAETIQQFQRIKTYQSVHITPILHKLLISAHIQHKLLLAPS